MGDKKADIMKFAGSWEMSDTEVENMNNKLRKLWSEWQQSCAKISRQFFG